jgi:hypothetical protein
MTIDSDDMTAMTKRMSALALNIVRNNVNLHKNVLKMMSDNVLFLIIVA